jgi:hypothetical protein
VGNHVWEIPVEYDWDSDVGVRIAPPRVSVGALIEQVQMCLETPAIAYWVVRVFDVKRGRFRKSSLPDFEWAYEFKLEDEDGKVFTVNVNTIRDGLVRVSESSFRVNAEYRAQILASLLTGLVDGMFDSDCLDIVVQAGLFGEIVYG